MRGYECSDDALNRSIYYVRPDLISLSSRKTSPVSVSAPARETKYVPQYTAWAGCTHNTKPISEREREGDVS